MSQVAKKRIVKKNSWNHLQTILKNLGVKNEDNNLILDWESPDADQFDFLIQLLGKIAGRNIRGDYDFYSKSWVIG